MSTHTPSPHPRQSLVESFAESTELALMTASVTNGGRPWRIILRESFHAFQRRLEDEAQSQTKRGVVVSPMGRKIRQP